MLMPLMESGIPRCVPFVYWPCGSASDIHISCKVLFPEEKNSLKIFVLSSIVAAKCEFGQGV